MNFTQFKVATTGMDSASQLVMWTGEAYQALSIVEYQNEAVYFSGGDEAALTLGDVLELNLPDNKLLKIKNEDQTIPVFGYRIQGEQLVLG